MRRLHAKHSQVRCPGASVSVRHEQATQPIRNLLPPQGHTVGWSSAHPSAVRRSGGITCKPSSSVMRSVMQLTLGVQCDICADAQGP